MVFELGKSTALDIKVEHASINSGEFDGFTNRFTSIGLYRE